MDIKRHIKLSILMLIGLLSLGILCQYVPHHHHNGRFCLEEIENLAHHSDSQDDCQLESSTVEFKGVSKLNLSSVHNSLYFTLLYSLDFPADFESLFVFRVKGPETFREPYTVKSHKLRGSPLFS